VWLVTGVLLAVAAVEFALVGVGSAGAFFPWNRNPQPPSCASHPFFPCTPTATPTRGATPTRVPPTPVSPPVCRPDAQHDGDQACDRQPASIQLTPDPITIHCDGFERSRVTVRITDSKGRPVPDGTFVQFSTVNGSADPYRTQTHNGVVATSVSFYSDFFGFDQNLVVDVGALEAGLRIRCFPNSNDATPTPTPPLCELPGSSPPSVSPPCATATPTPLSCELPGSSPPSVSPPCATPTLPGCGWPASPPCVTSTVVRTRTAVVTKTRVVTATPTDTPPPG
jgi:hypothetical protein